MAYLQLRAAILEGRLRPGQALLEDQLAFEFDISRTPLREALAMLRNDGLVEAVPYRGTFVSSITREEFLQTNQVRERLENFAIELAIDLIPDEEIERVSSLILQSRSLLLQGDLEAHRKCQNEFHGLAPDYSGNQVLGEIVHRLLQKSTRFLINCEGYGAEQIIASADEHLEMLRMYRKRDRVRAIELMTEHLLVSCERSLAFFPESGESP